MYFVARKATRETIRNFEPKTEESQRVIDMPADAMDVLRSFKKAGTSPFVLDGAEPNPSATYDYYRCDCTWRDLHEWLRSKRRRSMRCERKAAP